MSDVPSDKQTFGGGFRKKFKTVKKVNHSGEKRLKVTYDHDAVHLDIKRVQ